MHALDYTIRESLIEFRASGRLHVFMSLYLHANLRLRVWVGYDLIHLETGLARASISDSLEWLRESSAILPVPYRQRIGLEKKLAPSKSVYQLTGLIQIKGNFVPYLYLNHHEDWLDLAEQLRDLGNSSLAELLIVQSVNCSPIEPKVVTSFKDSFKSLKEGGSRNANDGADKDVLVAQIEAHPVWQAYVAGWNEQPIPPVVQGSVADITLTGLYTLQAGINAGKYTLNDIEAMTRQKLKETRKKGAYRFAFVIHDLPGYLAASRADQAQPGAPVHTLPPASDGVDDFEDEE